MCGVQIFISATIRLRATEWKIGPMGIVPFFPHMDYFEEWKLVCAELNPPAVIRTSI